MDGWEDEEPEAPMKDEPTPSKTSPQSRQVWKENVTSSSESPSQEVQSSESPPLRPDDAPEGLLPSKVLSGGLKNPNPHHEVTTVVIHIYFVALHKLFVSLAYLLFYIRIAFRK